MYYLLLLLLVLLSPFLMLFHSPLHFPLLSLLPYSPSPHSLSLFISSSYSFIPSSFSSIFTSSSSPPYPPPSPLTPLPPPPYSPPPPPSPLITQSPIGPPSPAHTINMRSSTCYSPQPTPHKVSLNHSLTTSAIVCLFNIIVLNVIYSSCASISVCQSCTHPGVYHCLF